MAEVIQQKMARVDLMEQLKSAYQLDRRSKFRFYLCLLFDQFNVALVNSFIVYKKLENKNLTLKEFKICIALKLISSFVSRKLSWPNHRLSKRIKVQRPCSMPPSHFPTFLERRRRCTVRKTEQNICYVFNMWCSSLPSKRKKHFVTISLINQQQHIFLKLCLNMAFMMWKYW